MKNPDYDQLWKDVITELFEEFLLFFAPDLYEHVDFTTSPQFLEQELLKIIPDSDSNKRVADKLVKLLLKSGQEQWVYVHIEIQGNNDLLFPKRMFQSFYRIMDYYDRQVYALALFTDKVPCHKLNKYQYNFFGTKLTYNYNTYHIASQSETDLLQSNNPFALAILAGLYLIQSKKRKGTAFQYKLRLIRLLLEGNIISKDEKREYIQKLLIFIDHIIRLPEDENIALLTQLEPLIEREDINMGLSFDDTSIAKYFKNLGREEGREEGKKEGKEEEKREMARNLLKEGIEIPFIMRVSGLTKEEVEKLAAELNN
ncbi:hypothetical protein M670_00337 [Schinkia azotoformans MEV2011]|uniref:Transposase (putative) YhgA-like domain-containing protein n=1 Tax=Schinkia azotoformans MEV2011 TaxID=1348973 RepID=A0A072NS61_SCHAZ|nr:hypothetical protein [Schinkia azotoformans]KEF40311.1 hypothetical protein M670_00337 [Schinkia azotoformans MEV2011]MEC1696381.1 hypothetical protein [Schinkia azotoformans]MEC1724053.1 hypothetical protein [Schinkia azotoformans]MEC1770229.1 hypothetical protein [Schinkia azotoformans]MED4365679.1 hypothetical protein [Schinkia azotoformans]